MIAVSDEWKNLHKQPLLPETFVEIRLDVTDVNVTDLVTITGTNQASFSNTSNIVNTENISPGEKYALLEYNMWLLDGSRDVVESVSSYEAPGFVSKDDTTSTLTISLSEIRSEGTPGFRILWSSEYGEYATAFTMAIKNAGTTVSTITVDDNKSNITQVELEASDYDSVVITVNEWSVPEHRARIDGVTFGCAIVFDKNQILSYTHEQTGDPLSSELSKNSIEFTVDNSDGRWDMLNPNGFDKYLYERQKLVVRYGMRTNSGVEWVQAGVFYLTEWRAPSNGMEATFVARDVFEFMLNKPYTRPSRKGVVVEVSGSNQTSTSGVKVFSDISGISGASGTVTATLPYNTSVNIYELKAKYKNDIIEDVMSCEYLAYRIDQGWIMYYHVTITDDESAYSDVNAAIQSCEISDLAWTYESNLSDLVNPVSVDFSSVGGLLQSCANKCGYAVWQGADAVLRIATPSQMLTDYIISTDVAYTHPEIEMAKPLKQVDVVTRYIFTDEVTETITVSHSDVGETITVDNPLVLNGPTEPQLIGQAYVDYWKHRGLVSGEYRADPRLELFDMVKVESSYGTISPVMITYIKYSYNGSFHGTYRGKVLSTSLVESTG